MRTLKLKNKNEKRCKKSIINICAIGNRYVNECTTLTAWTSFKWRDGQCRC